MKKLTTKLSNLHKHFGVSEYETEFFLPEDVFIETPSGEYAKINALVMKRTQMVECKITDVDDSYVCADKHIIMTPDGWKFMKDADIVVDRFGESHTVESIEYIGEQDSYDVAIDDPHTYCTSNGLVHHNTMLAVYHALVDVLDESTPYTSILIARSSTPTRQIGHLPGEIDQKLAPYEEPYYSICHDLTGRKDAYEKLKEMGIIEFVSTSFLRGATFNNTIVIFDEFQSTTTHEGKSVITRLGKNSKIIMCGDTKQNDLLINRGDVQGFNEILEVTKMMPEFRHFKFTPDDIVRSKFVRSFLIACEWAGI